MAEIQPLQSPFWHVGLLWGFNWPVMKLSVAGYPPLSAFDLACAGHRNLFDQRIQTDRTGKLLPITKAGVL